VALLPYYLLPLGLACILLGGFGAPWGAFAFMALYGISDGFSQIVAMGVYRTAISLVMLRVSRLLKTRTTASL
jgi:hypothetical protein